jgi:preprotein translocase subunit SecG
MLVNIFAVLATLAGGAMITVMCLQQASPDAGFSAAMGATGAGGGASRKGGMDELLEKLMKAGAVVWVACVLIIGLLEAHPGLGG